MREARKKGGRAAHALFSVPFSNCEVLVYLIAKERSLMENKKSSDGPESQFDFWLGEWDCSWGDDGKGSNRVERILDSKIIQENFDGGDFRGISVSAWDAERELWCQTWVDNSGTYLDFTGGFHDGQMLLSRDAIVRGEACKQRMVWYNITENEFDWNWERSDNGGKTWDLKWKIKYKRKQ